MLKTVHEIDACMRESFLLIGTTEMKLTRFYSLDLPNFKFHKSRFSLTVHLSIFSLQINPSDSFLKDLKLRSSVLYFWEASGQVFAATKLDSSQSVPFNYILVTNFCSVSISLLINLNFVFSSVSSY